MKFTIIFLGNFCVGLSYSCHTFVYSAGIFTGIHKSPPPPNVMMYPRHPPTGGTTGYGFTFKNFIISYSFNHIHKSVILTNLYVTVLNWCQICTVVWLRLLCIKCSAKSNLCYFKVNVFYIVLQKFYLSNIKSAKNTRNQILTPFISALYESCDTWLQSVSRLIEVLTFSRPA